MIVVDRDHCLLYEVYSAYPNNSGASWSAYSGAIFNLRSNALRPSGWTSADAAGLPILAGLIRYDEVQSGVIRHAIRFTSDTTANAYVWPATHKAARKPGSNSPPMGQRFRLKASFNITTFPVQMQVILKAMQVYGIILADNGSSWYINGAPDSHWNDDLLVTYFAKIHGSDFEAVDVTSLMISPTSGQVR